MVLAIVAVINLFVFIFTGKSLLFFVLLVASTALMGMVTWFFRDPETRKSAQPNQVLSVSDGVIVVIEPTLEREYFHDERIQVSTFMSATNVHINHVPIEGEIVYQKHHKGRFMPAYIAKSSEENERCTTVIRTPGGEEILIRQIAGIMARRIVTYKKTGEKVSLADELGFIRFGSRVDVFFPKTASIHVEMNQKMRGGVTVLGTLNQPK